MRLLFATILTIIPTALYAGGMLSEPTGGRTTQPVGHYDFCQAHPAECQATPDKGPLTLSPKVWGKLVSVNNLVNSKVRPVSDQEIYGKDEVWAYPDRGVGDCEDYALEKRRELKAKGIPLSDLLMTVVRRQDNGEGHAVLTVRTTEGDYILDNLGGGIMPWYQTPYTYLKRQSPKNAGVWVTIDKNQSEKAILTSLANKTN